MDELASGRAEQEGLVSKLDAIEQRLTPAERVDELDHRLGDLAGQLATLREMPAPQPDAGTTELLQALAARVDELASGRAEQEGLVSKLDAIEQRLTPAERVDELDHRLGDLAGQLATLREMPAPQPDAGTTELLQALAGRVDELASGRAEQEGLVSKLDAIEQRLTPAERVDELDHRLGDLAGQLATLREMPAPQPDAGTTELLQALAGSGGRARFGPGRAGGAGFEAGRDRAAPFR